MDEGARCGGGEDGLGAVAGMEFAACIGGGYPVGPGALQLGVGIDGVDRGAGVATGGGGGAGKGVERTAGADWPLGISGGDGGAVCAHVTLTTAKLAAPIAAAQDIIFKFRPTA
jgi:hypothetical protein